MRVEDGVGGQTLSIAAHIGDMARQRAGSGRMAQGSGVDDVDEARRGAGGGGEDFGKVFGRRLAADGKDCIGLAAAGEPHGIGGSDGFDIAGDAKRRKGIGSGDRGIGYDGDAATARLEQPGEIAADMAVGTKDKSGGGGGHAS